MKSKCSPTKWERLSFRGSHNSLRIGLISSRMRRKEMTHFHFSRLLLETRKDSTREIVLMSLKNMEEKTLVTKTTKKIEIPCLMVTNCPIENYPRRQSLKNVKSSSSRERTPANTTTSLRGSALADSQKCSRSRERKTIQSVH